MATRKHPHHEDPFRITPDMDIKTFYKTISAKGKVVMAEKRAKGEVMHKAPLGYLNVRDQEGKSMLMADPKVYPLIVEAIELRAAGHSIRSICRSMHERGLRSRKGKRLQPSSMQYILNVRNKPN